MFVISNVSSSEEFVARVVRKRISREALQGRSAASGYVDAIPFKREDISRYGIELAASAGCVQLACHAQIAVDFRDAADLQARRRECPLND